MIESEFIPGMLQTTLDVDDSGIWQSRCPVCCLHRNVSDPSNLPVCCGYKFVLDFLPGTTVIEPGWVPIIPITLKENKHGTNRSI